LVWNRINGTYQKMVDQYIALTNFSANCFVKGGISRKLLSVKPNFISKPPKQGKGRGGYAVYVGRLSQEKGLYTLLDAWKTLGDYPLKIIGEGPLEEDLKSQVNTYQLNVEFLGKLNKEDVLKIVGESLVQIVPSEWYEGFPMVILEAYACGTPVIASRIGSLNEVVVEGETGYKFTPGDSSELKDIVKRVFQSGSNNNDMRNNIRRVFNENYTDERNYDLLMNIYRSVIEAITNRESLNE